MGTIEHYEIARRWLFSRPGMGTAKPVTNERQRRRMIADGDTLYSYGHHFPLVSLVRTAAGKPSLLLVNGDTWRGGGWSQTGNHQSAVRRLADTVAESIQLPHVIIPASVIAAAGIDARTIKLVETTEPWYEPRVDEYAELPSPAAWVYGKVTLPGTGGWVDQRTGAWIEEGWGAGQVTTLRTMPGYPVWDRRDGEEYNESWDRWHQEVRQFERHFVHYPRIEKNTGRRSVVGRWRSWNETWEYVEHEDGSRVYRHSWTRHWLGESVIKAQASVTVNQRCRMCEGTGKIEPYVVKITGTDVFPVIGPMTEPNQGEFDRWYTDEHGVRIRSAFFPATTVVDVCTDCHGRRKVRRNVRRWRFYLSGFDSNEPLPSYFFCAVPGKPRSVAEAYENLRPRTVRLAEEMGREVKRQGEHFAIPTELTLRDLKRQGGVHHRRGDRLITQRTERWGVTRYWNPDCALHRTNHEATEVVIMPNGVTYARGLVRHAPDGRVRDHVHLRLGKVWHLMVINTVPTT